MSLRPRWKDSLQFLLLLVGLRVCSSPNCRACLMECWWRYEKFSCCFYISNSLQWMWHSWWNDIWCRFWYSKSWRLDKEKITQVFGLFAFFVSFSEFAAIVTACRYCMSLLPRWEDSLHSLLLQVGLRVCGQQVQEVWNPVGVIYLLRKCSEMNKMKSSENSYFSKIYKTHHAISISRFYRGSIFQLNQLFDLQ